MDALEKIIRPIVEGQIRGFLKEHPSIVAAVDWYKPRKDKATTFVNSLAKRIVLDLTCLLTRERIEGALFEIWESEKSGVELSAAPDDADAGILPGIAPVSTVACRICGEGDQVDRAIDLVAIARCALIMDGTYRPDHMDYHREAA